VAIGEWLVLLLMVVLGIGGLLYAASDDGTPYTIGLMVFVGAVVYAFIFIKQHFDRVDGLRS